MSYNYNKMPSQGICQSLCLWGIGGKTLLLSNFQDLGDLLDKNESFITNPFGFGKDILSFGLIWWKNKSYVRELRNRLSAKTYVNDQMTVNSLWKWLWNDKIENKTNRRCWYDKYNDFDINKNDNTEINCKRFYEQKQW